MKTSVIWLCSVPQPYSLLIPPEHSQYKKNVASGKVRRSKIWGHQ